ncbi:Uu.00g139700.m01.CDS01 [Anthostomella pinea]|uniref:ubiquitinyl hydrolase 1 n=1 Tax=Anthostomella pinea TaxID=933095 RepID=A0AAI8YLC2_9PEZI|nr:Uu.00g139700.m01.CDS01 [Anthostomella pinea]
MIVLALLKAVRQENGYKTIEDGGIIVEDAPGCVPAEPLWGLMLHQPRLRVDQEGVAAPPASWAAWCSSCGTLAKSAAHVTPGHLDSQPKHRAVSPMKLRYKAPSGGGSIVVDDHATVAQLFETLKSTTGFADVTVKYGWPPQALGLEEARPSVRPQYGNRIKERKA